MKNWNETLEVFCAARNELAAGRACAVVILTRVKGSAYRRPGAKLLVRADGTMTGNVSGGCLENDLRERALAAIRTGDQASIHYDTGSDEDMIWGLGVGCDGQLDLLVVPLSAGARHAWIEDLLARLPHYESFSLTWTCTNGPAAPPRVDDVNVDHATAFREQLDPPPRLIVVGAGDDAIPLVAMAAHAGFRVVVTDHRAGYLDPARFPGASEVLHVRPEQAGERWTIDERTMVVIKNHALAMDKKWARFFGASKACYIGVLGPKRRGVEVCDQVTTNQPERIFGPAGLDIGGEGAEQIAIAIMAELLAVWHARKPGHLRDREGPIHPLT